MRIIAAAIALTALALGAGSARAEEASSTKLAVAARLAQALRGEKPSQDEIALDGALARLSRHWAGPQSAPEAQTARQAEIFEAVAVAPRRKALDNLMAARLKAYADQASAEDMGRIADMLSSPIGKRLEGPGQPSPDDLRQVREALGPATEAYKRIFIVELQLVQLASQEEDAMLPALQAGFCAGVAAEGLTNSLCSAKRP